ncbi:MAG: erythromycin esterase family protein, partial [Acidobacteria bacterium]|nr:erythromycin esterase family protein [Acidobacteriota bacterium]
TAHELRRRYATAMPWERGDSRPAGLSAHGADVLAHTVAPAVDAAIERLEHPAGPGAFLDPSTRGQLVRTTSASITAVAAAEPVWWSAREQRAARFLQALVDGVDGPVVVWSHAARVGDASATDLDLGGTPSLGQACRSAFGDAAHLIGLGAGTGSVAAATSWGGHTEVLSLDPVRAGSVEELLESSHLPAFLLDLRTTRRGAVGADLGGRRPQRVVGPVVGAATGGRPAVLRGDLPRQFDEYIWIGATSAVVPIPVPTDEGRADRFPPDR